jgi:tetratricopeptide (TPR) repeat protein
MRTITTPIFFLLTICAFAQTAEDYFNTGEKAYDDNKYGDAVAAFKSALDIKPGYDDAIYYMGLSYTYSDSYEDALTQFTRLEQVSLTTGHGIFMKPASATFVSGTMMQP